MPSKQVLKIKVLSCGGLRDLMSEMEASFLISALASFRNVEQQNRAQPRANVNLARAYSAADFYGSVFGDEDMLHLIGHANGTRLEVGSGATQVHAADLGREATRLGRAVPGIVVSTGCKVQSKSWRDGFRTAGAKVLIATTQNVTPANIAAFDMAFYSALLSQTRRGAELIDRVKASFKLADKYYRSIHATGTPHAKFQLEVL